MNIKVCDLCNCRITNGTWLKVTIKQPWYSFYESGWEKLDVCNDCKRAIIELSRKKRARGRLKEEKVKCILSHY